MALRPMLARSIAEPRRDPRRRSCRTVPDTPPRRADPGPQFGHAVPVLMLHAAACGARCSSVERAHDLFPRTGLDEDSNELTVDVAVFDLVTQNIERAFDGHGALVRAVARRERIEDVADRHQLRLEWDLLGAEPIRIPRTVQPLVVRSGDDRNAREALPPGNLSQESIRVRHVAPDLFELVRRERALRHAQRTDFVRRE